MPKCSCSLSLIKDKSVKWEVIAETLCYCYSAVIQRDFHWPLLGSGTNCIFFSSSATTLKKYIDWTEFNLLAGWNNTFYITSINCVNILDWPKGFCLWCLFFDLFIIFFLLKWIILMHAAVPASCHTIATLKRITSCCIKKHPTHFHCDKPIHPSIQPPIRSSRRLRRVFQTSRWPYNHSSCKQCGSWPWLICPQPLPGCKRNNAGHGSLRPFVHRLLPDVHFLFGFAVREPSLHHLVQLTTRWWSLNTSTPFFIWVSKTKK